MFTMAQTGSSHDIENHGEDSRGDSSHEDAQLQSKEERRERVLKQVGLTSSTFIGPTFPPPTSSTVKPDIEDSLSEFYKELEKVDTPDGANGNPGKQSDVPSQTFTSKDTQETNVHTRRDGTDVYQRSSGHKHPSWSHWYQNEPYCPRRPITAPNQWHHPHTPNTPPNSRFHRPTFYRPPPPSTFPNPQHPPSHLNQNWSGLDTTKQYGDESHFPKFSRFPPPNVCRFSSQGFFGDPPNHFDQDERGSRYDAPSGNVNVGWSRDRKEVSHQFGEDHDRWEDHCQPPADTNQSSLVLILLRGLPGSGKSTLARELVSTGPSGLILSTDDYFVLRDGYHYDQGLLGAAHEWNQNRAKDAMHDGRSPIIIDNTNTQAWEMKPYVKMALERGYKVDFCEPDTSWKFDPNELEKRNKHGVPREKIAHMKDRFSYPISVDIVMSSQEPRHVSQRCRAEQPQMMMRRRTRDFH